VPPAPGPGSARHAVAESAPVGLFETLKLGEEAPVTADDELAGGPLPAVAPVVLAQYRDCFILAHDTGSLYLIDQHAAHERVLYEEIRAELAEGAGERQALLVPRTVELERGCGDAAAAALPLLAPFGFRAEVFGEDTVVLREVPGYLPPGEAEPAFRDLVQILLDTADPEAALADGSRRLEHRLAATVACHAAVKDHFSLAHDKMVNIVERLFRCREPLTCPHGRTAIVRWGHGQILRAFGRAGCPDSA
jgi:DNA mismatch repair protein MutL